MALPLHLDLAAGSRRLLEHFVDVDEAIAHERLGIDLRDVALLAKVASRGDLREEVAVAIHVVAHADGNRLRHRGPAAAMASEARIHVEIDLVVVDLVRDRRRLHRIAALASQIFVLRIAEHRRTRRIGNRCRSAHGVGERGLRQGGRGGHEQERGKNSHYASPTFSMRHAHFLKSVWNDRGSVASSVTLLMSCEASNHGTNTRPRGTWLRPRVSTRERISPRRETSFTSLPRRTPSAFASSGCM